MDVVHGSSIAEVTEGNFLFDARSPTLVMTNFVLLALSATRLLRVRLPSFDTRGPTDDRLRKSVGMRHKSPFLEAYSKGLPFMTSAQNVGGGKKFPKFSDKLHKYC